MEIIIGAIKGAFMLDVGTYLWIKVAERIKRKDDE